MNKLGIVIHLTIVLIMVSCSPVKPSSDSNDNLIENEESIKKSSCSISSDCPPGQICISNRCIDNDQNTSQVCSSNQDCNREETCVAKRCKPKQIGPDDTSQIQCREDKDCPTFMYCEDHICKVRSGRCANSTDCPNGYICNQAHYCKKHSDYCDKHSECPYGKECSLNLCKCSSACQNLNEMKCEDRDVYRCVAGANGCLKWSKEETCEKGQRCLRGRCVSCNHECKYKGQKKTTCPEGSNFEERYTCLEDSNGCLRWHVEGIPCGGNGIYGSCKNGECWMP